MYPEKLPVAGSVGDSRYRRKRINEKAYIYI